MLCILFVSGKFSSADGFWMISCVLCSLLVSSLPDLSTIVWFM